MGTNDNIRQIQTCDYVIMTDGWSIHVPIVKTKDTGHNVNARQNGGLWINIPGNHIETGQRQDLNGYELVQDGYLKSLTVIDNLERTCPPDRSNILNNRQTGHYSQTQRVIKIFRMSTLNREMEYLKRGYRELE